MFQFNQLKNEAILAEDRDISRAHSEEYINALKKSNSDLFDDKFGLCYDCPPQDQLYEKCQLIGGSTLSAARSLTSGKYKVAINWHGGWHHARKGFEFSSFSKFSEFSKFTEF